MFKKGGVNIEFRGRNYSITAEEWQSWRQEGQSTAEIAKRFTITPSMMRYIARKFRAAGYNDPQYHKTKPGKLKNVDIMTDAGAYILAILWGTTSEMGNEGYWIRHRNSWYINTIKQYLAITSKAQASLSSTGQQTRLKIVRAADVLSIRRLLTTQGWKPRQSFERPYPVGPINNQGFIRGWVELHSSIDITRNGRKRTATPRLRIYGNWALLKEINLCITAGTGLQPRTLQKTTNNITKQIIFTGQSYREVREWLYEGSELSNPAKREQFFGIQ